MCGIVGVITKSQYGFYKDETDVFFQMLYADVLRGDDSTGMIYAEKTGDFGIVKDAWSASWCADVFRRHEFLKDNVRAGKVLIGHNRKATVGSVSSETAHPFVVDDTFAMVHNGTLFSHRKLADTTVDSEALAMVLKPCLSGEVNQELLEETLGRVNGAYAVAIYDQVGHKVHLLRNSQRPLFLIETDKTFAFASEGMMAQWILARNGFKLAEAKGAEVPVHTLVSIDLRTNKVSSLELKPKKTPAPVWATAHTGASQTGKIGLPTSFSTKEKGGNGLSKNEFKRWKRRVFSQNPMVEFYVDDYVEEGFPRTLEDGCKDFLVFGSTEDQRFPVDTQISGKFEVPEGATYAYFDSLFLSGRIYDIEYQGPHRPVLVYVDRIKPVTKVYGAVELARDLDKLEVKNSAKTSSTLH